MRTDRSCPRDYNRLHSTRVTQLLHNYRLLHDDAMRPIVVARLGIKAQGSAAMNLSLAQAFGQFGARPSDRVRAQSAIADDGALVLACQRPYFAHPGPGILRYEDRLSRGAGSSKSGVLMGEHLGLARDGALPVRMIVTVPRDSKDKPNPKPRSFHVRPDLVGKLVSFDGDHFVVDFVRRQEVAVAPARRK
jgi:hypothetical protein